jgi:RNA polymerase sigma-70 factor, ECF subfamily
VLRTVELADLHEAMERLSERDRRLLEMRYEEDLTQGAIARRLGIPEGTVKVRLHRARAKLRMLYARATMAT